MITTIAESEACRPMLVCCGTLISNSHIHKEVKYALTFVDRFVEHSDIRREMVCDCTLLRVAIFHYLSGHFFRAPCEVQTLALSASFNVVHNYLRGPREENGISMLRDGSLCAV
jgi:hypothetical protein